MLVLTRKVGERIFLDLPDDLPKGTRLTVMIADIARGKVRIGFECPPEIIINREELLQNHYLKESPS